MRNELKKTIDIKEKNLILAMHSSSETFGVAVLEISKPIESLKSNIFPIGKKLSNNFLTCVHTLLPIDNFKQLARIAVSIGPGGFTSTRITLAMARIISQQIDCPLDGISNFALMAPRLTERLKDKKKVFWIINDLPRRGAVAGKYKIISSNEKVSTKTILEIEKPHLIQKGNFLEQKVYAEENIEEEIMQLIKTSLKNHIEGIASNWEDILPIYPTSPVMNK